MNYTNIKKIFYEATGTNSTSLLDATLNIYTQPAEDRVVSLILQSDGRWQYDDNNNTDFPIALFNLVSGQQDYAFAATHLKLLGVSVLGNNGLWRELKPFDPDDTGGIDRTEFMKTAGFPYYYDVLGQSAVMYPAPDNGVSVTLTNGGKFYFQRGGKHFDWTTSLFDDSTGSLSSSPGFNSLYHSLIPLWAAYNYNLLNNPSLCAGIMNEIQRLEAQLILDYSKRNKDERTLLTTKQVNFR